MAGCPPLHIPHKEWSGNREELENYTAIERWARCKDEGCSCYVEHRETTQTIDPPAGGAGDRADPVLIDPWSTINTCGTFSDDTAMLVLHLNWSWQTSSGDPYISDITGAGLATLSGRLVEVFGEGTVPPADLPIARDTRLALGTEWYYDGSAEGGSLSVPLNLYPAGPDFSVYVAQSSGDFLDITLRADLYTVCACSCVL